MGYPKDISSLTRVRFFAALWVVLFHWRTTWAVDVDRYTGLLESGRYGVDIFFVLSGFVLAHVYFRKVEARQFDYGKFLVARLARIYPLHIAVFGFVGLMVVVSAMLGIATEKGMFPLGHILPNVLLIQAWGFTPGATWNVPAWSISAEWFAYLMFPLFALLGLRFARRPFLGLALGLLLFFAFDRLYLALIGSPLPSATDNLGILRIVPEFLIGFMLYLIGRRTSPLPRWLRNGGLALTILALVLAAHWRLDARLIALLSIPLVYDLAELSKITPAKLWRFDPTIYLGRVSYSIYLLHVPFFMAVYNVMQDLLGWVDGPLSTPVMLAVLAVFLPVSMASYHLVETPARVHVRYWGERLVEAVRAVRAGNTNHLAASTNERKDIVS